MFLELPAELRNRIYTFATYATTEQKCCVVPCLALAQTCRQIRHEYRALCLKAEVTINWRDVPLYFETFFPTNKGNIANVDLAPECITIFTNKYVKKGLVRKPVQIDLLPILKLGLANKKFKCKFVKRDVKGESSQQDEDISRMQTVLAVDVETIQKLLTHANRDWVDDIIKGRIHRIMVSYIGTDTYPRAKFYLGPGEHRSVPSEFTMASQNQVQPEVDDSLRSQDVLGRHGLLVTPTTFSKYMERVELRDIFLDNQYVFLWGFEWVQAI